MSRRKFIESCGASCNNWRNAWSFVNTKKKFVIFGAWDTRTEGNVALILSEQWQSFRDRKQPGFTESREHIRLIEEESYTLKTFPMEYSDGAKDALGKGPSKIGRFTPQLTDKYLYNHEGNWYATDNPPKSDRSKNKAEVQQYLEGESNHIAINTFERNREAREACISYHGYKCIACNFDFENVYGSVGKEYIHVHHIVPLSQIRSKYKIDPINDLVPICPNCHAIIHRTVPPVTVDKLKDYLKRAISSRNK